MVAVGQKVVIQSLETQRDRRLHLDVKSHNTVVRRSLVGHRHRLSGHASRLDVLDHAVRVVHLDPDVAVHGRQVTGPGQNHQRRSHEPLHG